MIKLCDSCLDSATDDGVPISEAPELMMHLGLDWADHICDQREIDENIHCACSCYSYKKKTNKEKNGWKLGEDIFNDDEFPENLRSDKFSDAEKEFLFKMEGIEAIEND